jgi:hypothetical protein
MKSMTYGKLPGREEFDAAFERECPNGYSVSLNRLDSQSVGGFKLGDGKLSADELWEAIREIVTQFDNERDSNWLFEEIRMDLVSSILFTLGFEWV